jgi:hypothetical protein
MSRYALRAMSKRLAILALLGALALAPAGGAAADHINLTGVEGQVLDATCYGPCIINQKPPPYTGEATVIVRDLRSGQVFARVPVVKSLFRAHVPPGAYRVRVRPKVDVVGRFSCWKGSSRRVKVPSDGFAKVRLTVINVCVV